MARRLPPPAPPPIRRTPRASRAGTPSPASIRAGSATTRTSPAASRCRAWRNQREEYLLKAMREYKSGARIGYAGAMATELQPFSDDDLRELAHYFSHLGSR